MSFSFDWDQNMKNIFKYENVKGPTKYWANIFDHQLT